MLDIVPLELFVFRKKPQEFFLVHHLALYAVLVRVSQFFHLLINQLDISIDPFTSDVAVESLSEVLVNAVSAFWATCFQVLGNGYVINFCLSF